MSETALHKGGIGAVLHEGTERGLCFQIIHGSFVDGYGIRTTVFLKGCPLRCKWCCNPEGQATYPELKYSTRDCTGCGRCVDACPTGAITMDETEAVVRIDRSLCTNCAECIEFCYTGALDLFGAYSTVDELFAVVRKDEQYYAASGGGVSIGGGEPTLQPLFTYAFMKKCQANSIRVAIDTCGFAASEEQFRILAEADLLLYDLKGLDPAAHLRNTGVSNELILENLVRLNDLGKAIIVRIPVIPGWTVSRENVEDLATFLGRLKSVERVDLIPYHQYGDIKHEQLGRAQELEIDSDAQELAEYMEWVFGGYWLNVQLGG